MWSGIEFQYGEKYPIPGKSWADLLPGQATAIICLEQRGGVRQPALKRAKRYPEAVTT